MNSGETIPTIRIFISSPSDVAEERAVALASIRRLQGWFQGRVVLVPILWEQEPLLATAGFQHEIDRRVPPSKADVALFVLWARLGTPLSEHFVLEDGRHPTGTEWEFREAAAASVARELPHILVYRKAARPLLDATRKEEALAALTQYQAVQQFFEQHFRDAKGLAFTGSFHAFHDASEFGQLLETHLATILGERTSGPDAARITWHGSPFRGLKAFEAEHARVFFGRTRAIQQVRQALAAQVRAGRAFVLILGASGTGKSSLVRAGLLPLLSGPWVVESGVVGGFCRQAILRPGDRTTPLEALAAALQQEQALPDLAAGGTPADLAGAYAASPEAAVNDVRGALGRAAAAVQKAQGLAAAPPARLVLLVDQMEELFTRSGVTPADREAFERVLDGLARSGLVWVVATLRSDFYPALSRLKRLMAIKEGAGQYDLAAPDAAEIGQIVRLPAQIAGLRYQGESDGRRALDDTLVAEASRRPDLLPLLQFTLQSLYEACPDGVLTHAAYERLGGIEGALRVQAEAAWDRMSPEAREAFAVVLRGLVEVPAEGAFRPTARRALRQDLARHPGAEELIDALVVARLLVADGDGDAAVVAVSHESLFRVWERARDQILSEGDLLRIHSRLRGRAQRWDDRGRRHDLLLQPGEELAEGERLVRAAFTLAPREREFVAASQRRARRMVWRKRVAVGAILAFAAGSLVLGLVADRERRNAEEHAREARRQHAIADSERQQAEASRREAVGQREIAEAARGQAERHREEALRQAGIAEEVNRFLNDDLLGAVSLGADDVELTVGQLLDRASQRIEGRFEGRPEVECRLRHTIGSAYYALGLHRPAVVHAEASLRLATAAHGEESLACADALELLGLATRDDEQGYFERAHRIRAALLGEKHPLTLRVYGYVAMSKGASLTNPMWFNLISHVRGKDETPEQVREWARRVTLTVDRAWREQGRERTLALIDEFAEPVTRDKQFGTSASWALAHYAMLVAADDLPDAGEAFATWAYERGVTRHGRRHSHTRFALNTLLDILLWRGAADRALPWVKALFEQERADAAAEPPTLDLVLWYVRLLRRTGSAAEAARLGEAEILRIQPEGALPSYSREFVLEVAKALHVAGETASLDALLSRLGAADAATVRARLDDE